MTQETPSKCRFLSGIHRSPKANPVIARMRSNTSEINGGKAVPATTLRRLKTNIIDTISDQFTRRSPSFAIEVTMSSSGALVTVPSEDIAPASFPEASLNGSKTSPRASSTSTVSFLSKVGELGMGTSSESSPKPRSPMSMFAPILNRRSRITLSSFSSFTRSRGTAFYDNRIPVKG